MSDKLSTHPVINRRVLRSIGFIVFPVKNHPHQGNFMAFLFDPLLYYALDNDYK